MTISRWGLREGDDSVGIADDSAELRESSKADKQDATYSTEFN